MLRTQGRGLLAHSWILLIQDTRFMRITLLLRHKKALVRKSMLRPRGLSRDKMGWVLRAATEAKGCNNAAFYSDKTRMEFKI